MGSSILNIGITGLNAAQTGLVTTGHNIANAATPGYSRQQIVQTANTPQFTGQGFIGQGTSVLTVKRIYSQFLANSVTSAQARSAELATYRDQIEQIDNLLADPTVGLTPSLQAFFSGVQEVASNPNLLSSRQSMLSTAQTLTARFNALDARLDEMGESVDNQLVSTIDEINSYAKQIADLNQRIVLAQAAGDSQPANDLLDQREQLVLDLNSQVRVTTTTDRDGSFNVFIGNGQPLVVGGQTYELVARADNFDQQRLTIGYKGAGGVMALQENMISGGALGGLLAFRSGSLDTARNALGRLALGMPISFNEQHRLGQDLAGALGGDFFTVPQGRVLQPTNPQNSGTAEVSIAVSDVSALTTSDYKLDFDGTNYTLTRLSDRVAVFTGAALPASVEGLAISITGTPDAGDTFLIQPTRTAARDIGVAITDPRSIAAAAPVRAAAASANTGSASVSAPSVDTAGASLGNTIEIRFTAAGTYDLYNATTSTTVASGQSLPASGEIAYNGWTVKISGAPAAGDVFTVSANTGGVSDSRNALALAGLQTANLLASGSASYQGAYSLLVSDVGNKTREMQVTAQAQESLLSQAKESQQSVSGVNLDEEAGNLIRYQQAYQAAGKVIEIASKLFDELLSLGR